MSEVKPLMTHITNLKGLLARALLYPPLLAAIMLTAGYAQQDSLAVNADTSSILQEGFSGGSTEAIDYEALVKELYGEEEKTATVKPTMVDGPLKERSGPPAKRGPAPGLFRRSAINGAHLAMTVASPFAVATPLESWYSYIDASVTIKLPYEIYVESIPLYLSLEISSFSFENTFPEGGVFAGLAYLGQVSSIGESAGAILGFGFWDRNLGSMVELNYRFRPSKNSFLRLGTRGVLISDIDPLGPVWWLELRLSLGLEL